MDQIIRDLNSIDWADLEEGNARSQQVLHRLFNDPGLLLALCHNVLENEHLCKLCEHYDFFDKIVLYADKKNTFRLRLHIFLDQSHRNRVHYHRWNYTSMIFQGHYQHLVFGTDEQIGEETSTEKLTPIMVQQVSQGNIYSLNHNVFHSVSADPGTISVIVRGPVVKEKFLIIDKTTNQKWWEYGRESETIEETRKKIMPSPYLESLIQDLSQRITSKDHVEQT